MFTQPPTLRAGLCALAAAISLIAASPAFASFPATNGRISFARYDSDGFEQLWTANPDLSHAEQITNVPGANSVVSAWAPDNSRIAFDSDRSGDAVDIFTMKPDGSDVRKLTNGGFNGEPSYSPDGSLIAFESDRGLGPEGEGIYTMRPDGSDVHLVIPAAAINKLFAVQAPKYSPDGRTIAFTAERRALEDQHGRASFLNGETGAVFLVDSNGSHLRRLTPWGYHTAIDVEWSPDGAWLAFETDFQPANAPDLYLVHPDGSGLHNLTNNPPNTPNHFEGSSDPAWAPDGSRIMLVEDQIIDGEFGLDLYTIRPDGTNRQLVQHTTAWEDQPAWGSAPLK